MDDVQADGSSSSSRKRPRQLSIAAQTARVLVSTLNFPTVLGNLVAAYVRPLSWRQQKRYCEDRHSRLRRELLAASSESTELLASYRRAQEREEKATAALRRDLDATTVSLQRLGLVQSIVKSKKPTLVLLSDLELLGKHDICDGEGVLKRDKALTESVKRLLGCPHSNRHPLHIAGVATISVPFYTDNMTDEDWEPNSEERISFTVDGQGDFVANPSQGAPPHWRRRADGLRSG